MYYNDQEYCDIKCVLQPWSVMNHQMCTATIKCVVPLLWKSSYLLFKKFVVIPKEEPPIYILYNPKETIVYMIPIAIHPTYQEYAHSKTEALGPRKRRVKRLGESYQQQYCCGTNIYI